jgi:hypothetical protein
MLSWPNVGLHSSRHNTAQRTGEHNANIYNNQVINGGALPRTKDPVWHPLVLGPAEPGLGVARKELAPRTGHKGPERGCNATSENAQLNGSSSTAIPEDMAAHRSAQLVHSGSFVRIQAMITETATR